MDINWKRVVFGLVLLALNVTFIFASGSADELMTVPDRDRVCMVQDTVMAVPAVPVEHEGKTYYGCCEMCKGRITADPAQYTRSVDPVSGKVIDKATASLLGVGGRVLYFESESTRDKFRSDPSKYARAVVPNGRQWKLTQAGE